MQQSATTEHIQIQFFQYEIKHTNLHTAHWIFFICSRRATKNLFTVYIYFTTWIYTTKIRMQKNTITW